MISGVYQIVNLYTKKLYIGSAKDLETRYGKQQDWTRHHNSDLVIDALNGDRFLFMIIQECESYDEALCMEQWWLNHYIMNNMWDRLYNKNKCVWKFNVTGMTHTQEAKQKISIARTGKKCSQETRDKISAAQIGKKRKPSSQEAKEKIGKANKGKKKPPRTKEHCAAISASKAGKKQTPELIAKRVASNTGKKRSEEALTNMRNAAKNRKRPAPLSIEHRNNISVGMKAYQSTKKANISQVVEDKNS
ncbi:MAG: NUMOD3 domain-containing DNA-binding protein [Nanoarchaeota archaeon]